jgi:hypothetical protein
MVKYLLSFILIFFISVSYAQKYFPPGVANTYTLTEKDGYSRFMYLPYTVGADGTIYISDYNGNVEIHGNNYAVALDSLNKINRSINNFKIIDSNEVWAYGLKHIVILKNKKVAKVITLPINVFGNAKMLKNHVVYFFAVADNTVETWVFDGLTLKQTISSNISFSPAAGIILETPIKETYLIKNQNDSLFFYRFNAVTTAFEFKKAYAGLYIPWHIKDENNFLSTTEIGGKKRGCKIKNGNIEPLKSSINTGTDGGYIIYTTQINDALYKNNSNKYYTVLIDSNLNLKKETPFICNDEINAVNKNLSGNLYLGYTGNRLLLISPYVKKYPSLFNQSNSSAIFTVREDNMGRIWAGSYQNNIAIVNKNKVIELKRNTFKMMNGGDYFNGYMYLIGEGHEGLLRYDMKGNVKPLNTKTTGFYTYLSNNKKHFYYSTTNNEGLWQTTTKSLATGHPVWNKIQTSKGLKINNILTITEDTLGRIWCGHPGIGITIYNPITDKANSWRVEKNETAFGGFSSLTDKQGTVWMGSRNGLWYYNDYTKEASPQNCKQLAHPLLNNSKLITALTLYNNWLVIAAYDKVLLLDLKSFYQNKKILLRYLNPYEAAFTSFTEQNTMLTAKDSSVWFSTSDMLYQWDIKNWLALPTFKIKTSVVIKGNNKEDTLKQNNSISFKPSFTSFDIHVQYVSADNMPRYVSAALIKEGDTILLPQPGLQSVYSIKNIAAGNYNFILDVFETDGTTIRYIYPITIKKYLWQQWWFWALLSAAVSAIILYLYNLKQKKQVAEAKAKTAAAELQSFKSEQEKKIANLQLVTLSNQFRPHFILNALNTIGAQMDDKPEAESVLSRLGESVNLIFNHSRQQKILHHFINEWSLVQNVIHIHRLMYLKNLETSMPSAATIEKIKQLQIPLGILQIPVENALLHGLSNREVGPWQLKIDINEAEDFVQIIITDNGVGRKKSAQLSNFTKHGTGTKNSEDIITIINQQHQQKITLQYTDDVYELAGIKYGTAVTITVPKNLTESNG